ncbi:MAG: endonuclease/exonuclease/phosphatase family protein [Mucinivorans sp.]
MGRLWLVLLLILPLKLFGQDVVVSYNIRNGHGMDSKCDLDRTSRVINSLGARFVALQEVDSVTARSGGVDVLSILAQKCNMEGSYARAIPYDGGAYGIGLLSCEKPLSLRRIPLDGREEARVLLIAEFEDCILFCTHFSLTAPDQMSSIKRVIALAKEYKKRVFFMGDLNLEPSSEQFKLLKQHFHLLSDATAHTYPADEPATTIDYIWSNKKLRVSEATVVSCPTESDHRPVMVRLKNNF